MPPFWAEALQCKGEAQGRVCNRLDEDVAGDPELKWRKVDLVPVVEIWQLAGTSLSLFWDLIAMLWEHIMEQWKQTELLEQIAHIQELFWVDWVHVESGDLETGLEGSKGDGTEESEVWGRKELVKKVDKGKGKERVEDGNKDRKKDGNEGGDGNGVGDRETLQ